MVELELLGVSHTVEQDLPVVLLRQDERILPIFVGKSEANAIQLALMQQKPPRPLTHDLICNLLTGLRAELQSITIYKIEDETFYAHLNIIQRSAENQIEQMLKVDSRPSDGIALAVRVGCPIYAAEEVMDIAAKDSTILSGDPDDDMEENDSDPDDESPQAF